MKKTTQREKDCGGTSPVLREFEPDVKGALRVLFETSNKRILSSWLRISFKTLSERVSGLLKTHYSEGYAAGYLHALETVSTIKIGENNENNNSKRNLYFH